MKHGSGIKDRDDKSSGIEILMAEGFRHDERLKGRVEESTYLTYTGLYDKTN